jgi:hypothetical protein
MKGQRKTLEDEGKREKIFGDMLLSTFQDSAAIASCD